MLSGCDDVRQINVLCRTTKNTDIDTLINKLALFIHTSSCKTWNVNTVIKLFLFGYHFEYCFVRLCMLSGYDDVRQINVSCRTTKNAGIDTLINKLALFVHTSCKTWNVNTVIKLLLLGYHFEHCVVRLCMLSGCDDTRQINVLRRTTKNAGIDTLINKLALFVHTSRKTWNVNTVIKLLLLG